MGLLFAMTLPGLVVLLIVAVALERFGLWVGRSWLPWRRHRTSASAVGVEELASVFAPGKRLEQEQRAVEYVLRDDELTGAPPDAAADRWIIRPR